MENLLESYFVQIDSTFDKLEAIGAARISCSWLASLNAAQDGALYLVSWIDTLDIALDLALDRCPRSVLVVAVLNRCS